MASPDKYEEFFYFLGDQSTNTRDIVNFRKENNVTELIENMSDVNYSKITKNGINFSIHKIHEVSFHKNLKTLSNFLNKEERLKVESKLNMYVETPWVRFFRNHLYFSINGTHSKDGSFLNTTYESRTNDIPFAERGNKFVNSLCSAMHKEKSLENMNFSEISTYLSGSRHRIMFNPKIIEYIGTNMGVTNYENKLIRYKNEVLSKVDKKERALYEILPDIQAMRNINHELRNIASHKYEDSIYENRRKTFNELEIFTSSIAKETLESYVE